MASFIDDEAVMDSRRSPLDDNGFWAPLPAVFWEQLAPWDIIYKRKQMSLVDINFKITK